VVDVVIIGAGVAGLAAASQLGDREVVVLERGPRLGGRVHTRHHALSSYELGALFSYAAGAEEMGLSPPQACRARGPIGIVTGGHRHVGHDVAACLNAAMPGEATAAGLAQWSSGAVGFTNLDVRLRELLSTFFQAIHPGDIARYTVIRQRDALVRFANTYSVEGNCSLIEALRSRHGTNVLCGAAVEFLSTSETGVLVTARTRTGVERIGARAAIVATTAPQALRLVPNAAAPARSFLERVHFGGYRVGVLGVREGSTPELSCLVRPGPGPRAVYFQPRRGPKVDIVNVYWPTTGAESATSPDRDETLLALQSFGVEVHASDIVFADGSYWVEAAPIVCPEAYDDWDESRLWPSQRITLAGDYTQPPACYGMTAALRSGKAAAERILRLFRNGE
jgi:protoporphyrinogen oxidase